MIKLPDNPIFIVGLPRSGTTLLQTLLATQKNIYSLQETHFFSRVFENLEGINETSLTMTNPGVVYFNKLLNRDARLLIKISEDDYTSKLLQDEIYIKDLFELLVKTMLNDQNIKGSFVYIEKTPLHILRLDLIKRIYPNCKIIHIIRHPLPTIYSAKKNFNKNSSYKNLAGWWNFVNSTPRKLGIEKDPSYFFIRYEDFISDVDYWMDKLSRFLDFQYESNLLKNRKEMESKLAIPNEKWKSDVFNKKLKNTNKKAFKNTSLKDQLDVYRATKQLMYDFGYINKRTLSLLKILDSLKLSKLKLRS